MFLECSILQYIVQLWTWIIPRESPQLSQGQAFSYVYRTTPAIFLLIVLFCHFWGSECILWIRGNTCHYSTKHHIILIIIIYNIYISYKPRLPLAWRHAPPSSEGAGWLNITINIYIFLGGNRPSARELPPLQIN